MQHDNAESKKKRTFDKLPCDIDIDIDMPAFGDAAFELL